MSWTFLVPILAALAAPANPRQGEPVPAAAPDSASAGAVEMSNRFVPGRARRYRVTSTSVTTTGRQQSKNPILDETLSGLPVPPVERATLVFDEEEHCARISEGGVADVSYRCLGFEAEERVGNEKVLAIQVRGPADLVKVRQVPKYFGLAALMEAPIRFSIDSNHVVHRVELPGKLDPAQEKLLVDEYRRNLQTRYQAFFPDGPVRPGDRWSREVSTGSSFWGVGSRIPDKSLRCTVVFARIEPFRGRTCAVLEVAMDLPIDGELVLNQNTITKLVAEKLSGRSDIRFDLDTGTPMDEKTRVEFRLRRVIGTAQTEPIDVPVTIVQEISAEWQGTTDAEKPSGN